MQSDRSTNQPLFGIRVVCLTAGISGGYASKLLADARTDVLKFEPPEGDPLRPRSLERITRASAFVADRVDRHTRAELEAGSVPFPMPDASELGDQIHLGYGMPEALQKLLGLGSATW